MSCTGGLFLLLQTFNGLSFKELQIGSSLCRPIEAVFKFTTNLQAKKSPFLRGELKKNNNHILLQQKCAYYSRSVEKIKLSTCLFVVKCLLSEVLSSLRSFCYPRGSADTTLISFHILIKELDQMLLIYVYFFHQDIFFFEYCYNHKVVPLTFSFSFSLSIQFMNVIYKGFDQSYIFLTIFSSSSIFN